MRQIGATVEPECGVTSRQPFAASWRNRWISLCKIKSSGHPGFRDEARSLGFPALVKGVLIDRDPTKFRDRNPPVF